MNEPQTIKYSGEDKPTLLAVLRQNLPNEPSWTAVRKVLRSRVVAIGGVLCLDEGRRVGDGEVITISTKQLPLPPNDKNVSVLYVDNEIVIVEKPPRMETLRRKQDWAWPWARKNLHPTLDECVPRLIGQHAAERNNKEPNHQKLPKLFPVHRLDRDSSGVLVFARNAEAQTTVIKQFAKHNAVRKYLALIPGTIEDQTVESQFIRDRGDGVRGSTNDKSIGQNAITHFKVVRNIDGYSEVECKLETGRTNQIRIHLSELGHPICGDIKYRGPFEHPPVVDKSGIHRMALHATELRFEHPTSGKPLLFETPWPRDMQSFMAKLGFQ